MKRTTTWVFVSPGRLRLGLESLSLRTHRVCLQVSMTRSPARRRECGCRRNRHGGQVPGAGRCHRRSGGPFCRGLLAAFVTVLTILPSVLQAADQPILKKQSPKVAEESAAEAKANTPEESPLTSPPLTTQAIPESPPPPIISTLNAPPDAIDSEVTQLDQEEERKAEAAAVPVQPSLPPAAEPCRDREGEGPEMVLIEAARFAMGLPASETGRVDREGPQHRVAVVRPFAIARCETTVGQFRRFVQAENFKTDAEKGGGCFVYDPKSDNWTRREGTSWRDPGFDKSFEQSDSHPVVCVSYNDARAYARWLSERTGAEYRLPSEAEWEHAARAGSLGSRFWENDPQDACAFANGADLTLGQHYPDWAWELVDCKDGFVFTAPVGSFRANAFGLADMLGNAREWVEDCWHDNYKGAPVDGSAWLEIGGGDCALRVLRGGSWDDGPWVVRSAFRDWGTADVANDNVGFRLARTL